MTTQLLTLFFLFAISTTLPSAIALGVADTDWEPIRNNGLYFILASGEHGIELAQLGNDISPVSVVPSAKASNGLLLRIGNPTRIAIIRPGVRVNIEFFGITPSYWQAVDDSVKIGERKSFMGQFYLEIHQENLYKIFYCADAESNNACEPLRISSTDGHLNLVDGDVLLAKFKAYRYSLGKSIAG